MWIGHIDYYAAIWVNNKNTQIKKFFFAMYVTDLIFFFSIEFLSELSLSSYLILSIHPANINGIFCASQELY
jgi:hypothetical protein